jgi:radical SAM superfamily enzyme YgiQ (UPF0313 family)
MKLERIMMVEPRRTARWESGLALPPLGLPLLGTLARREGYKVEVLVDPERVDLSRVDRADLLCLSTMTATAPATYRLADEARARGVPVVMGGAHPSLLPDEALVHADWVLRGEAELSFLGLLNELSRDGDLSAVPGLSYRDDKEVHHNRTASVRPDLDELPPIDTQVVVGGASRLFPGGVITLRTSRRSVAGDPRPRSAGGGGFRHASVDRVASELELRRDQGDRLFFCDEDFCAAPERTADLLSGLLECEAFLPPWTAQVSPAAAHEPELLELMARAGCSSVVIRFTSRPPTQGLRALYPDREAIRGVVRSFCDKGIGVRGLFEVGGDEDRVSSIRQATQIILEEDFKSAQFCIFTPYPGTPLHNAWLRQGRILTCDWSRYDGRHVVFQPAQMSARELMDETFAAWDQIYSLGRTTRWLVEGRWYRALRSLQSGGQARQWHRENQQLLRAS